MRVLSRRLVRGGLALALLFLTFLLGLWIEHRRPLELPRPTGPYAVGRTSFEWIDPARTDPYAPSITPRRLVTWIWYPAQPNSGAPRAEYFPQNWQDALTDHAGALLTNFLSKDRAGVQAHSLADAAIASEPARLPIVIFRSGLGALALIYTTLAEDLASHGYVVVAADTPYSTSVVVLNDGRVIHKTPTASPGDSHLPPEQLESLLSKLLKVWTADNAFLIDCLSKLDANDSTGRFKDRLDLQAIGVAGHSFGGDTAARFCHDDRRCKVGVDVDGALFGNRVVVNEGTPQPFMFLLSDHGRTISSEDRAIFRDVHAAASHVQGGGLIVTLRGAHHFSFTDEALIKSPFLWRALSLLGVIGNLDSREGLEASTLYLRTFFDT